MLFRLTVLRKDTTSAIPWSMFGKSFIFPLFSLAKPCLTLLMLLATARLLPAADKIAQFRHGSWPFTPPVRPVLPVLNNLPANDAAWVKNPIDAFILHKLHAAGLRPSAPAEKPSLLRRVTFDLTGLPPTVAEQDAFLADTGPQAFEKVVDRLLASPAYGERWGTHWLDLVRYAETDGFKADDHRPSAHKYRDYIIKAFNDDLPFDRFLMQQIAGDELEPDNSQAIIATGFLRHYPDEYNAANLEQRRQEILDDITGVTGSVFMGLSMNCAQCHDHKFDEILQTDYFRLQAFFAPLITRDDLPDATPEQIAEYRARLSAWEQKTQTIRDELEKLIGEKRLQARLDALGKFRAEIQEAAKLPPEKRTPYQEQIALMAWKQADAKEAEFVKKLTDDEKKKYEELKKQLAAFDAEKPAPLPNIMSVTDVGKTAPPTHRLETGNWHKPAEEVLPGFPKFLGEMPVDLAEFSQTRNTTGRRSALARWLARADHPLTSRVMVNRLWQHHFGEGIIASTNDFGSQGDAPTHPDLLDWLACEFSEQGWSLKKMHRLMVLSATYQQSSQLDPSRPEQALALKHDPANSLLWKARRRRLEGEAIRDAMLSLSGELNRRMYGPSAKPDLPEGVSKRYAWNPDAAVEDRNRRSVYVLVKRNLRYPLFDAFDLPDLHHSCPRRSTTTTAPQALLLINGDFSLASSRRWGETLLASHQEETALIDAAYRAAFGRPAGNDDKKQIHAFLDEQAQRIKEEGKFAEGTLQLAQKVGRSPERTAAILDLCHVLLNANEFLYVD